jgi:hypothetical protein
MKYNEQKQSFENVPTKSHKKLFLKYLSSDKNMTQS